MVKNNIKHFFYIKKSTKSLSTIAIILFAIGIILLMFWIVSNAAQTIFK